MRRSLTSILLATSCLCFSAEEQESLIVKNEVLTRADSLPIDSFDDAPDAYLEGYIQSLIDMNYYEQKVSVSVKDHKVYLYNLPHNDLLSSSIISFVKDLPGVKSVEVKDKMSKKETKKQARYSKPRLKGIWFPQGNVLFPPLVADPRQPVYSVAYRGGDKVVGKVAAAVSIGDDFPIFRWRNILRWQGDMQIGIDACIWAVFNYSHIDHLPNHKGEFSELINTDYYVGIPLSYAVDRWAFRLRGYHISSHLGDEFLVNHPNFIYKRKNPSFEALDFFVSYQFSQNLRAYLGPGIIAHSDSTFPMKTFYVEYGFEVRLFGRKMYYHGIYGTPFFAVHLENWQARGWNLDSTYKVGYEWSKVQGIGRKARVYADYHQGYSYEGQFFKKRVKYGEVGIAWGF
jgi:hypothetical protein